MWVVQRGPSNIDMLQMQTSFILQPRLPGYFPQPIAHSGRSRAHGVSRRLFVFPLQLIYSQLCMNSAHSHTHAHCVQRFHWKSGHKQACGAAAGSGSSSESHDPDVVGQTGEWGRMHPMYIHKLIVTQSVRMKRMPYIADSNSLKKQMSGGLETSLRGDFTWSLSFKPRFYAELMYEGFLPIASELSDDGLLILMPKLHTERCLLQWSDLHISTNSKRRCGK